MHYLAKIRGIRETEEGTELIIRIPGEKLKDTVDRMKIKNLQVEMRDNRLITPEQNRKFHATVADIAEYEGEPPTYTKEVFKFWYCAMNEIESISLSNCTVTQARGLINMVMDHAIENNIPLKDPGVNRTDDINRYLYMCILNRICCICGERAVDKVHHATGSRIGMGNNRNKVNHVGRYAIALCRDHHNEIHPMAEQEFYDKYKVYPIKLDEYAVKKLKL